MDAKIIQSLHRAIVDAEDSPLKDVLINFIEKLQEHKGYGISIANASLRSKSLRILCIDSAILRG